MVLNNIMARKGQPFYKIIENKILIETLLVQQCEETWWTLLILYDMSKETGNCFININDCLRIGNTLQNVSVNQIIWEKFQSEAGNWYYTMYVFNNNKFNKSKERVDVTGNGPRLILSSEKQWVVLSRGGNPPGS